MASVPLPQGFTQRIGTSPVCPLQLSSGIAILLLSHTVAKTHTRAARQP